MVFPQSRDCDKSLRNIYLDVIWFESVSNSNMHFEKIIAEGTRLIEADIPFLFKERGHSEYLYCIWVGTSTMGISCTRAIQVVTIVDGKLPV